MNKTKLLTISVIVLLLLNLGILAFLFLSGPKRDRHNGENSKPKEIIIHKLHFDKSQIADYDKIIKIHFETIKNLDDSIKTYKIQLYSELKNTENKSVSDSLFSKIAQFQTQIEQTHYNHFLDIKKICKPEQLEDYNQLTTELAKIFSPNHPKPRRER